MKKGLLLFAAVVLMGLVAYTVWYINRRGELAGNSKDSFIPDNSALVISLNTGASLSEKFVRLLLPTSGIPGRTPV